MVRSETKNRRIALESIDKEELIMVQEKRVRRRAVEWKIIERQMQITEWVNY